MLCPKCGFDFGTDWEHYPTQGSVEGARTIKILQEQWMDTLANGPAKQTRRIPAWLMAAAFAVTLVLGIWLGTGIGGDLSAAHAEQQPSADELRMVNILRSETVPPGDDGIVYNTETYEYSAFGLNYPRNQIRSVTFLDTLADAPRDALDVSEAGNGAVLAWAERCSTLLPRYDLYIGAEGGVWAGESCNLMFAGYTNLQRIEFAEAFHTDGTTDMSFMFWWCENLTELDLSGFDTANVGNMSDMFSCCRKLEKLDLSSFNTANVECMRAMFVGCNALSKLDLHHFNTSRVQDMSSMFSDCDALQFITLSDSFVPADTDTTDMFLNCPAGSEWGHIVN